MNKDLELYITKNYYILLNVAKTITNHSDMAGDLLHSVIVQFYDAKNPLILKNNTDKQFYNYVSHCLKMNWHSKTSRFYYQYKKNHFSVVELTDYLEYTVTDDFEIQEQLFTLIEESYTDLSWFHRAIMEMYILTKSMKEISRQTNIPETSIHKYIKEARTEIKRKVNKKLYE